MNLLSIEPGFTVDVIHAGALAVLRLGGELGLQERDRIGETVDEILDRSSVVVAIDLRELEFIDSSGLRAVLLAAHRFQDADRRCFLIRGRRQVAKLFDIVGFESVLEVVDDLEEISVSA